MASTKITKARNGLGNAALQLSLVAPHPEMTFGVTITSEGLRYFVEGPLGENYFLTPEEAVKAVFGAEDTKDLKPAPGFALSEDKSRLSLEPHLLRAVERAGEDALSEVVQQGLKRRKSGDPAAMEPLEALLGKKEPGTLDPINAAKKGGV